MQYRCLDRDLASVGDPSDRSARPCDGSLEACGLAAPAIHTSAAPVGRDMLLMGLAAAMVGNPQLSALPWGRHALIARIESGQSRLNGLACGAHGDYRPATPKGLDIHDRLAARRDATRMTDKRPWRPCVVRIDRASGKVTVMFECDRPDRSDATPQTVAEVAARVWRG